MDIAMRGEIIWPVLRLIVSVEEEKKAKARHMLKDPKESWNYGMIRQSFLS